MLKGRKILISFLIITILIITILFLNYNYFKTSIFNTEEKDDDYNTYLEFLSNQDFEEYLENENFPESYRIILRELHKEYPNWIFYGDDSGLDWNTVIDNEDVLGESTVYYDSPESWKSKDEGAYDSVTNTFTSIDSKYFNQASREIIEYYMDPRNFLKGNSSILQFEAQSFSEIQNIEGIKDILDGSFMDNKDYYKIFYEAGKENNVNPYFLAARALQEVSLEGSNSSSGTYSGYEGYYNFFNIGAYPNSDGSGAIINGLIRAQNEGWTSPEKSIKGGAKFISGNYINKGQDTLYYQKFNVVNKNGLFTHQYMTNIEAPVSESEFLLKTHKDYKTSAIIFKIPIFENMPESPAEMPV